MALNVPVVHDRCYELPIRDLRVDWSVPWLIRTMRAVDSAYRTSAWFDYYRDGLYSVLEERPDTLFELNIRIVGYFLSQLGLPSCLIPTEDYAPEGTVADDYRSAIHPKRPDTVLSGLGIGEKPYFQVFSRKYGFVANLSIMDLLFNEGPDSLPYIKRF